MRLLAGLFIFCILLSCGRKNDPPKGILKPKEMQEVFWDYIRADVYATDYLKKDSSKNAATENLKLQEKIFSLHHTTREQFYKSYTWYSNHKEIMTKVMDSMISKQQRLSQVKPVK